MTKDFLIGVVCMFAMPVVVVAWAIIKISNWMTTWVPERGGFGV